MDNQGEKPKKKCKHCQADIELNAKVCPNCRRRQGLPVWAIILIIIGVLAVIGIFGSSDSKIAENAVPINNSNSGSTQTQQPIEYIKVSKDELDAALDKNAASAKETYNNKYVEVTGRLSTIDSDLKYFSLVSSTDTWDLLGVYCKIKTSAQKEVVKTLTKDQELIVRGKITDVGEILGYYLDVIEIIAN